jgi:hypothetical protein
VVRGSFQPFLEALRGYEVTSLKSTPAHGHSASEMDTIEKG